MLEDESITNLSNDAIGENIANDDAVDMNVNALTVDMGGNTDTENVVTVEEAAVAENICTVGQNILRYTCGSYNVSTTSKAEMDNHVNTEHKPFVNEEVIFSCKKCKHDFKEEDNYINHMKNHEISSKRDVSKPRNSVEFMVKDYSEVENAVFCHILESLRHSSAWWGYLYE